LYYFSVLFAFYIIKSMFVYVYVCDCLRLLRWQINILIITCTSVRESGDAVRRESNNRIVVAAAETIDESFDAFDRRKRSRFVDKQRTENSHLVGCVTHCLDIQHLRISTFKIEVSQ